MMKKTETNLKQIAYETIKRKIIHCDYMPNDILSEMMLMEPYIIEHYSQYIDHVKLQELRKQTEEILQTDIADNEHAERCCDLDDELHRTIADACKNKYLSMNLSSIYDQNMRIRILGERNIWERHKIAANEHLELINYIESGDLASAVAAMRVHLIHSKEAAFESLMQ